MKNLRYYIFILLMLAGLFSPTFATSALAIQVASSNTQAVQAQQTASLNASEAAAASTPASGTSASTSNPSALARGIGSFFGACTKSTGKASYIIVDCATGLPPSPPATCGITSPSLCIPIFINSILETVGNAVLSICSIFLYITGLILNTTLSITILNMKSILGDSSNASSLLGGITLAWKIIRDFINMLFIFVLLYTAVATILNVGGDWRKTVGHLILVAIFINFSLFMTEALIDISNLATYQFYSAINTSAPASNTPTGTSTNNAGSILNTNFGISGAIMQRLHMTQVYNTGPTPSASALFSSVLSFLAATLGGAIFILVTSFVFLTMSILLIIRFVVLIFLLIFSPAAFIGWLGIGRLKQYSKTWWDALINNLLFAPAMMIMLWISLQLLGGLSAIGIANGAASSGPFIPTSGGGPNALATMFNFIVLIIFMVASIIVAKKAGAGGADLATKWGGKATFGVAAKIGQQTLGRAGSTLANSDWLKNRAKNEGFGGFAARRAMDVSDFAAKSSYDGRNTGGLGKAAGLGKVGKGESLGYDKWVDEKTKAAQRENARYAASDTQNKLKNDVTAQTRKQATQDTNETIKTARDEAREKVQATMDAVKAEDAEKMKAATEQVQKMQKEIDFNTSAGLSAMNPEYEGKLAEAKTAQEELQKKMDAYADTTEKATDAEFENIIRTQADEGDQISKSIVHSGFTDESGAYKDHKVLGKDSAELHANSALFEMSRVNAGMSDAERKVADALNIAGVRDSKGNTVVKGRRDFHADVIANDPFMAYNGAARKKMADKVRDDIKSGVKGGKKSQMEEVESLLKDISGKESEIAKSVQKKPKEGLSDTPQEDADGNKKEEATI